MSIPIDKELYEIAKQIVYKQYKKASAYRSGALVKKYKELGGDIKMIKQKKINHLSDGFSKSGLILIQMKKDIPFCDHLYG